MSVRKVWNRTVAQVAREVGVYELVLGAWGSLDRSVAPEVAVGRLVAGLGVDAPARVVRPAPAVASVSAPASAPVGVVALAREAARVAMAGSDVDPLAFPSGAAWVRVWIDCRTREAKALMAEGFGRGMTGELRLYVGHGGQSMALAMVGARAAAQVLKAHGFDAYAASWID